MGQSLKSLEDLYVKGDFEKAISFLKSVKGDLSPATYHFNLGSLYAKKGDLPTARFHLELSRELDFSTAKVENNLKFVRDKLGVMRIEEPKSSAESLKYFSENLSPQWFLSIFLVLTLVGLISFKKTKNIFVMFVFLILGLCPYFINRHYNETLGVAIIKMESVLYEGPSSVFEQSGELPSGLKIYLSEQREGDWYFIEYPESFRGWVQEKNLNFIKRL